MGHNTKQLSLCSKSKIRPSSTKPTSLFLPHSTCVRFINIHRSVGLFNCIYIFNICFKIKSNEIEYKYLLIFILKHRYKSDSILYINSVMLIALTYFMVLKREKKTYEKEKEFILHHLPKFPANTANSLQTILKHKIFC